MGTQGHLYNRKNRQASRAAPEARKTLEQIVLQSAEGCGLSTFLFGTSGIQYGDRIQFSQFSAIRIMLTGDFAEAW